MVFVSKSARLQQKSLTGVAYWDREIVSRRHRIHAWLNMLFVDHGIFRLIYTNFHKVTEGLWRSAQPSPGDVRRLARRGLKTIVNLRAGRGHGAWPLEMEAAKAHGIEIIDFPLRSRDVPDRETLLQLISFFRTLPQPILVHCKSGADRAGLMSTLYLLLCERQPYSEAIQQLSPAYGHFRWTRTGILDCFFERYVRDSEEKQIDFETWVTHFYDAEQLRMDFKNRSWKSKLLLNRL